MEFGVAITRVGEVIDVLGVLAIVVGVLYATADAAVRRLRRTGPVYARFRRVLGRGIRRCSRAAPTARWTATRPAA